MKQIKKLKKSDKFMLYCLKKIYKDSLIECTYDEKMQLDIEKLYIKLRNQYKFLSQRKIKK